MKNEPFTSSVSLAVSWMLLGTNSKPGNNGKQKNVNFNLGKHSTKCIRVLMHMYFCVCVCMLKNRILGPDIIASE